MKKILLSLLLIFLLASTNAQNAWVRRTDFPGCPRYAAAQFAINDKIYIVGGLCTATSTYYYLNDTWEYDINTNSWMQKDSLFYGLIYAGSFMINQKGYVFGGLSDSMGIRTDNRYVSEYDPLLNQWTLKNNYTGSFGAVPFNEISFSIDSFGYSLAPAPSSSPSCFQKYSPQNDSWNSFSVDANHTNLFNPLAGGSVSTNNSSAYLFTGNNSFLSGHSFQHRIIVFNGLNDSCDFTHNVGPLILYGIDSTLSGNFNFYKDSIIYFGLGTDNPSAYIGFGTGIYFDKIFGFDLRNDSLTTYSSFPWGPSAGSNYVESNGRFFLICGDGGMSGNKVVEFFPDSLTTTINEITRVNKHSIIIFPNPAYSLLTIKLPDIKLKEINLIDSSLALRRY